MGKITVLGIGNILMRDEGLGVHAVETLTKQYQFPDGVQLLDGGCLGMELFPFLADVTQLLLVDAVNGELPPGGTCKYSGPAVKRYFRQKLSTHEIGISEVLASLEIIGKPIAEIVIAGMKPAVVETGLELSATVAAGLPDLYRMILDQLQTWGVQIKEKRYDAAGC